MTMLLRLSWLEAKLLLREPVTLVFTLGLPIVMELVMGGVFGNDPNTGYYRGVGAMNFYMPAYVGLVIGALGLITLPTHIATYKERGVLRRFEASSIPRWTIIGAHAIVMAILAAIGSVFVVVLGTIVYDTRMPDSWLGVVGAFLLATAAFAMIGTLLGLAVPTARAAQGIGIMLWFVMLILGGAGPPPEALPDSMNTVGSLTPLKHAIITLQDPWLSLSDGASHALIVAGFLIGALALTVLAVKRSSAR